MERRKGGEKIGEKGRRRGEVEKRVVAVKVKDPWEGWGDWEDASFLQSESLWMLRG